MRGYYGLVLLNGVFGVALLVTTLLIEFRDRCGLWRRAAGAIRARTAILATVVSLHRRARAHGSSVRGRRSLTSPMSALASRSSPDTAPDPPQARSAAPRPCCARCRGCRTRRAAGGADRQRRPRGRIAPGRYRPRRPQPSTSASTTLPLARNAWRQWQPSDLETVNAFEHEIRKHAQRRHVVRRLGPRPTLAPAARGRCATWKRSRDHLGAVEPLARAVQPRYRLRNIIAGRFDPYIRPGQDARRLRRPVRLRFAQEMNGNWYPWSEHANGNRPHEFVRAWRHIHDIFRAAGATNVEWVWSPGGSHHPE